MKKKLIALIIITTMLLSACGGTSENVTDIQGYVKINGQSHSIREWVSPDGIHYWVIGGKSLTPRYDEDGELIIDKE